MRLFIIILPFMMLFSACTVQMPIDKNENVRYDSITKNIASEYLPININRIEAPVCIIIPDKNKVFDKINDPGTGIKEAYHIPIGRIMTQAAGIVIPEYFSDYRIVHESDSYELSFLNIKFGYDMFDIENSTTSISDCHTEINSTLSAKVMDGAGRLLFERSGESGGIRGDRNCFSASGFEFAVMELTLKSVVKSMSDTLSKLSRTQAVFDYLQRSLSENQQKTGLRQSESINETGNTPKDKLRIAFENGEINADQLSRALAELSGENISKLLDAFSKGVINGSKFGELY